MKGNLWTAAMVFAVVVSLLSGSKAVYAVDYAKEAAEAQTRQEVRETQIKYASYICTGIVLAAIAYWLLSSTNQKKKKYADDLKKKDRLDPNEGMPIG
jgi:hypothetical protein